ncbi:MAG: hypothetical protein R6V57_13420 [Vicinamibacterales bacterium]
MPLSRRANVSSSDTPATRRPGSISAACWRPPANRADLLIRLGRFDDAAQVLDELDAGVKAGIDAYVGRARRAAFLRALADAIALRPQDAIRHLRDVQPSSEGDSVSVLAPVLLEYVQARLRRPAAAGRPPAEARSLGQADKDRAMRASAQEALVRLRSDWPAGTDLYLKRPDLAEVASRLGQS